MIADAEKQLNKGATHLIESTKTPLEKLQDELKQLETFHAIKIIDDEQFDKIGDRLREQIRDAEAAENEKPNPHTVTGKDWHSTENAAVESRFLTRGTGLMKRGDNDPQMQALKKADEAAKERQKQTKLQEKSLNTLERLLQKTQRLGLQQVA